MAKLNPGFDVHGAHKLRPPLTKRPNVQLTDYVVQQRLFTFFLPDVCVPLTPEMVAKRAELDATLAADDATAQRSVQVVLVADGRCQGRRLGSDVIR